MNRSDSTLAARSRDLALQPPGFAAFHQELDRLCETFGRGLERFNSAPRLDLAETTKALEITLELPGVDPEDIDIAVEDGVLTISGQKRADGERQDQAWQVVERSFGAFSRSVRLPAGVDIDQVRADLTKGVLKIFVPKPAATQSQHIAIMTIR